MRFLINVALMHVYYNLKREVAREYRSDKDRKRIREFAYVLITLCRNEKRHVGSYVRLSQDRSRERMHDKAIAAW